MKYEVQPRLKRALELNAEEYLTRVEAVQALIDQVQSGIPSEQMIERMVAQMESDDNEYGALTALEPEKLARLQTGGEEVILDHLRHDL
mmetsp:Transcript_21690/g.29075  ORF Transcript_21690/g.29075 Transcript_21690/m.29075 type:complete len:89 (+) Transcript_21690:102-368(+)